MSELWAAIECDWFAGHSSGLLRVALLAPLAYAGIVMSLRIAGKRSVAKLTAFDLVVTIALGSALSTTLLSERTPLAVGLFAVAILVALQWFVSAVASRVVAVRRASEAEPRLLAHEGRFVDGALPREHLSRTETFAAVRRAGYASLEDVEAVVLEASGDLSVVARATGGRDALEGVRGFPHVDDGGREAADRRRPGHTAG